MTNNLTTEEYSFLASLGLTFDVVPSFKIQPETGLVALLNREKFIGNDMYGMLKLALAHHHNFIRIDALVKAAKTLTPIGRATLSALAAFCVTELKDKRFKKIKKYSLKIPLFLNSKEYVDSTGAEPHLFERGIVVRIIQIQDEKKMQSNDWIFKKNVWFRNRLILGLGVRADTFSALQTNHIKTYYELSKFLGSSIFSARKNFQDFYKIKKIDAKIVSLT